MSTVTLSFVLGYIPIVGKIASFVFMCWVDAYVFSSLFRVTMSLLMRQTSVGTTVSSGYLELLVVILGS